MYPGGADAAYHQDPKSTASIKMGNAAPSVRWHLRGNTDNIVLAWSPDRFNVVKNQSKEHDKNISKLVKDAQAYAVQLKDTETNLDFMFIGCHMMNYGLDLARRRRKQVEALDRMASKMISSNNYEIHTVIVGGDFNTKVETLTGQLKNLDTNVKIWNTAARGVIDNVLSEKENCYIKKHNELGTTKQQAGILDHYPVAVEFVAEDTRL